MSRPAALPRISMRVGCVAEGLRAITNDLLPATPTEARPAASRLQRPRWVELHYSHRMAVLSPGLRGSFASS